MLTAADELGNLRVLRWARGSTARPSAPEGRATGARCARKPALLSWRLLYPLPQVQVPREGRRVWVAVTTVAGALSIACVTASFRL